MSAPSGPADVRGVISRLVVYPIKSCAGVPVQRAFLTETGLEFDRAWMVVDAKGNFLTQRELPRMVLVRPQLRQSDMVLRAPGMLALHIGLDQVEAAVRVKVWNDEVKAYDMGAVAAQWFSDFLGVQARLVRFDPEERRISSRQWTGDVEALNQFSDGYPVLVISETSLAGLNERLVAAGSVAVPMERFRPNIVLGDAEGTLAGGADAAPLNAHDEDRIDRLDIQTDHGMVQLRPVKPCPRCPIVNIDPDTATSSPEVSDVLQTYRGEPRLNGAIAFGMNMVVLQGTDQLLEVGQPVSATYRFD